MRRDSHNAYHVTRGIRRGGGVAIYTNNELSFKMVETKSIEVENILECVTVELTIKNLDTFCENIEHILSDAKSIKTIFV